MNVDAQIIPEQIIEFRDSIGGHRYVPAEHVEIAEDESEEFIGTFDGYLAGFRNASQFEPAGFRTITEAFRYLDNRAEAEGPYVEAVDELFEYLRDSIMFDYTIRENSEGYYVHTIHRDVKQAQKTAPAIFTYTWERGAHIRAIDLAEITGQLDVPTVE